MQALVVQRLRHGCLETLEENTQVVDLKQYSPTAAELSYSVRQEIAQAGGFNPGACAQSYPQKLQKLANKL
ncbi:hypothetical protein [Acidovorax sp. CCYZU-2555]|uniref:hypothetical protein n=1 Tax=Acidovorax sp. CCYZU-2555 TaxID=2835042 RepID=UPI001BCDA540|nr:hypothetical protein [Acidovorax sp. CCYZU-2555]MBS7780197.1 hypothetical protein [Acidovorax sp. CCYZU-2555]